MLITKAYKIMKDTITLDKKLYRNFGFYTALIDFNKSILFRKNNIIGKKLYYKKYENFKKIFYNKYKDIMESYFSKDGKLSRIKEDSNIYFFWWQGIDENTPKEIIQNLNSVKRNCNKHKVIVLTKDTIKDFVEISDNIYEKLKKGKMTITHFSDILRAKLLSTYGGIWSDASFYWKKPLPDYIYKLPIFSIKHGLYSDFHICKGMWTVSLLASGEKCLLYKYMFAMFERYWNDYDYLCCYLLIDVFLSIAYDKWKIVKEAIDKIPYNNEDVFFFYDNGTKKYNEKQYNDAIISTSIFRNHPRMKKSFETKSNEKTYYYHFYNDYLKKEEQ